MSRRPSGMLPISSLTLPASSGGCKWVVLGERGDLSYNFHRDYRLVGVMGGNAMPLEEGAKLSLQSATTLSERPSDVWPTFLQLESKCAAKRTDDRCHNCPRCLNLQPKWMHYCYRCDGYFKYVRRVGASPQSVADAMSEAVTQSVEAAAAGVVGEEVSKDDTLPLFEGGVPTSSGQLGKAILGASIFGQKRVNMKRCIWNQLRTCFKTYRKWFIDMPWKVS